MHLEESEIQIFDYGDLLILVKKFGAPGNSIPNFRSTPIIRMELNGEVIKETYSDCPHVGIRKYEDKLEVSVWGWIPGPGPGDFNQVVQTEKEAVDLAMNYFFQNNENFLARLAYHVERRVNE